MTKRRRLPKEQAREEILVAAADLLRTGGHSAVTLVAVARAVGVSHQSVSYHFKTREALLEITTLRALDAMYKSVLQSVTEALQHPEDLIVELQRTLRDDGHARVLAALVIQEAPLPPSTWSGALITLKDAFASVVETQPGTEGEALRVLELLFSYALGQAIFGQHLRETLGIETETSVQTARDEDMARWLMSALRKGTKLTFDGT